MRGAEEASTAEFSRYFEGKRDKKKKIVLAENNRTLGTFSAIF